MIKLVTVALRYYGTNPRDWPFPWCAAFLNLVLSEAGIEHGNSLLARSYLKIGQSTNAPKLGDIVVLWRVDKASPWGHCGLYINEDKYMITLLGGNQDGTVKVKRYPKWQLLDIKRINV